MPDKDAIIVTPEMSQAGYEALKVMANQHGYGWGFSMVGEHTIELAMGSVFRDMIEAAPKGWTPFPNPGVVPPVAERAPGVGIAGPYDVPPPEAA